MRSLLSLLKWDWLWDTYSLHNAVLAVFAQMRLTMTYVQPSWCGPCCLCSNEIDYEIRTAAMMRSSLSLLKWDWLWDTYSRHDAVLAVFAQMRLTMRYVQPSWCGPCCLCSNEIDYEIRTGVMMRSLLSLLKWDTHSRHDAVLAVFAQMRLTMRYVQPSWCGSRCLCASSAVSPEIHRDWLWDTYSLHDAVLAVFAQMRSTMRDVQPSWCGPRCLCSNEIDYEIRTAVMMRSLLSLLKWDWLWDTYSLHDAVLAVFAQMRLTMRYVQPSWCGHRCLWSNEIDYEIRTAFMMRSLLSLLKWDWLWDTYSRHDAVLAVFAQMRLTMRYVQPSWCGPRSLCSNEIDYELSTAIMMRSLLSLLKWDWLWDTYSLHDVVIAVFAFLVLSVQRYTEIDYEIRTAFMMRSLLSLRF